MTVSEAMSMILRLQREKAEVQVEFRQLMQFAEGKMAHDSQELITLVDAVGVTVPDINIKGSIIINLNLSNSEHFR